jgi:hypothetical protein
VRQSHKTVTCKAVTCKTVTARCWSWLLGKTPYSFFKLFPLRPDARGTGGGQGRCPSGGGLPGATHYTPHTTHYTLHTTHYTLHTAHCTLHTTHCIPHPTPYNLHPTH